MKAALWSSAKVAEERVVVRLHSVSFHSPVKYPLTKQVFKGEIPLCMHRDRIEKEIQDKAYIFFFFFYM